MRRPSTETSAPDEELLVLRDPLELAEPFAVDAIYEPVLDALDGQRTLAQIRQSLLMRGLAVVELEDLEDFVEDLGELGLLDDDRFRARWSEMHDEFADAEIRAPRRAGLLYPDDPAALREWLGPVLPERRPSANAAMEQGPGYGSVPIAVVVAHQPPPALGDSLARLLASLPGPEHYERVIILATDHSPGLLPYASADKDWDTPLGPVACDLELLAKLDDRLPWLLREQTRLRVADSIEWATLLLRALWGDRCPPILPLACGQTRLTSQDGAEKARELMTELAGLVDPREVLWWTAAELSHVGPAYGHAQLPTREQVEAEDRALIGPLLDNQPQLLARACMDRAAAKRPSGTAALATLADVLPAGYRATLMGLDVLPAAGEVPGWIGCATVRIT